MSFSEQIKQEILDNSMKNCCKKSLRFGELFSESKDVKKTEIKSILNDRLCCKKAFLKGVFLGSGYIVSPNKEYHFEVSLKTKAQADFVISILKEFNVEVKVLKRNTYNYIVYAKDSEKISVILSILGANNALMEYENIRIEKSIKNDINRNINCETANINKTVTSAYKQLLAIQKLKKSPEYEGLSVALKEVCNLRLNNPEASLDELANLFGDGISKSGIYHRLNKIVKISEKL
ncbi:MAG: DNA-binding protein WhiA [Clostridia bacterium]|nr:DNA-binding protein WhiA [Clostridia bacterium]